MAIIVLNVPRLSSERCEHTIRNAIEPLVGVRAVELNFSGRQVFVSYDEDLISPEPIAERLRVRDYPAVSWSAPPAGTEIGLFGWNCRRPERSVRGWPTL